jgi:uncharacterized protein YcbX
VTARVVGLSFTPVKGTRIREADRLELGPGGAPENRRFYVVDERGHMINSKRLGELTEIVSELVDGNLRLSFPRRAPVEAPVIDGETLDTRFFSRPRADPVVLGPFSDALSDHLGVPVRLVRAADPAGAVDRGEKGTVSLISRGSLAELARQAEVENIDVRRFRMLVEIDGVPAHAEDRWVGEHVWIGSALVALRGHVGRCLITSRDPDSGRVDLPTLDVLRAYRGEESTTEPLPFGVYGEVVQPGTVSVGDEVTLAGDRA